MSTLTLTLRQLSTQTLHHYLSCSLPKTGVARSITENANPASHMGAHKTRDALANPDFLSSLGRPQPRCPHNPDAPTLNQRTTSGTGRGCGIGFSKIWHGSMTQRYTAGVTLFGRRGTLRMITIPKRTRSGEGPAKRV